MGIWICLFNFEIDAILTQDQAYLKIVMASSNDVVEISELLKAAKDFKVQGLKFLNEGKFKAASDKYQMILDTLEGKEMGHHETERKDLIQVKKQTRFDSFI